MSELKEVAPAFIEMAHRIVYCSAATVDSRKRPRSRVLHPIWEYDGTSLVGWIATSPTPLKRAHFAHSPYMSCNYWAPDHDTCTAECRAELLTDDATRIDIWQRFKNAPPPIGYDPAIIPRWPSPTDVGFAVIRLEPWRLRVFPATAFFSGDPHQDLVWQGLTDQPAPGTTSA
jgi:hypothetical protein